MSEPLTVLARADDSTLVVMDVQTQAAAAMPQADAAGVCGAIAVTLRAAQILAVPVICTQHREPPLGAVDPRIAGALPDSAYVVHKSTWSAWRNDDFANAVEIAARPQVVICGFQAHVGVLQTAVEMAAGGYQVFVPQDGVCSRQATLSRNALARLHAARIVVTSTESLLHEWLAGAGREACSQVLAILQER